MAFSGARVTALIVMATPGKVQAFSAKAEAEAVPLLGGLLTVKIGT